MLKEIKYNGYTAQPSDYESPDGDLSLALGMVPENGALKPVMPPKVLTTWQNVHRVFVHKNNFTHYIVYQNSVTEGASQFILAWCDDTFGTLTNILTLSNALVDITAIGNMLIIADSKQMYYVLWKNGAYSFLANSIPDIRIAFGLSGEVVSHTYSNKQIAATTSSNVTGDEGWTTLKEFAWSYSSSISGGSYSDYKYLDTTISLIANTNYAISAKGISGNTDPRYYISLEGKNSSGTYVEIVTKASARSTAKHVTFTPKENYTNLRMRVYNRGPYDAFLSGTLVLESGAQAASVTLEYSITNSSDNYTAIMGVINSFANKYATQKERFMFPFFVRYAMKLYDGSYKHISSPILMVPNSGYVPLLNYSYNGNSSNIQVTTYAFITDLQMMVLSYISDDWADIIDSVDIFVSAPIYPYSQGQEYDASNNDLFKYKVLQYDDSGNVTVNELQGLDYGNLLLHYNGSEVTGSYDHVDLYSILNKNYSFGDKSYSTQWRVLQLAARDASEIRDDIISNSSFYLIRSYKLSELPDADGYFVDVDIKKGALESLVNKTALDDELLANRTLMTGNLYAYNNRLHAFNASFKLPEPTPISLQNQMIDPVGKGGNYVFVKLHSSQGTKIVSVTLPYAAVDFNYYFSLYGMSWFFYPDNNAYQALFVSDGKKSYRQINLTKHDYLNGAYWLADTLNETFDAQTASEAITLPTVDDILLTQSNIYVSEVNNPFTFLAVNTVSVGCNKVLALSSAAKPMSTGQFGQFPLYAFTDNGVWSLETSSTGSYIARQPITRDVIIRSGDSYNTDGICQLESSVLFPTDRGIMELSGSTANCITDIINTEFPFSLSSFGQLAQLLELFNGDLTSDEKKLTEDNVSLLPFKDFIANCRIVNDYAGQRIIIFNPSVRYAYVFSRLSSAWGMMQSDNALTVNSYPEAQTVDEDGNLLDYGKTDASRVSALLVTRPFAMGEPDIHKTVMAIIQRGYFRKEHVAMVLYGSQDLFSWYKVSSSKDQFLRGFSGQPYKYFRLAVLGRIQNDESLYGCTVQYTQKMTNQPR